MIGALGALSSGVALVLTIVTGRPLWLSSTFIFVPGLLAIVGVSVALRRDQQRLFLARCRKGLVAGVLSTAAYDVTRAAIEGTGMVHTSTFAAIRVFGAGLTSQPAWTTHALIAGWAFHVCNGLGFAVAYTLVAAGRFWVLAIGYALGLEAFIVALYPSWLGITLTKEFVSVGVLGHIAYGTVLGCLAKRSP
jgi:hypothetical protein